MGLFPSANDFKAGKGVEKDAPRKTGVRRFFELVGRDMNSMFLETCSPAWALCR